MSRLVQFVSKIRGLFGKDRADDEFAAKCKRIYNCWRNDMLDRACIASRLPPPHVGSSAILPC